MKFSGKHRWLRWTPVLAFVLTPAALCAQSAGGRQEPSAAPAAEPANLAPAMAQYRRALAEYLEAQARYAAVADAYWRAIAEKRRLRNAKRANHEPIALDDYVLVQPPAYGGPPKPRNPLRPYEEVPPAPYVPTVADFLAAALAEFKFTPRLPRSEEEFKRAYAETALAAGLTKEQIVRIYGFESGGNGTYDVQAGLEYSKRARPITTALGYNQLLATNSVEILAESGDRFIKRLAAQAARLPQRDRQALEDKIAVVRSMVSFSTSVPDDWNKHQVLANTPKGLGVHAMNLDLDVGPLLQTQKLLDSVVFARRHGLARPLTAAELEMMNLTGDGNGFDMVTMTPAWRDKVPTANFFQRSGYSDNPVAQRNNVVARLIAATDARMDEEVRKPGAQELAASLR
jgi:hypothetical protein